jgi:multidrug resistance protein, MATE family
VLDLNPVGRPSLRAQTIALAWPAIAQGLLTTTILFTDRLILGRFSDAALASMQVSGPVLWSVFSLFGAFGIGVLAVIGRAVGEGNREKVARAMGTAIALALVLGSIVGLFGYFFTESITGLIVGDDLASSAKEMAHIYMGTVFLSGPLMMLGSVNIVAFQASGDTKTPMWLTGAAGFLNLGLSWVLVFGGFGLPAMGILGAALGTVAASFWNAFGGLLLMYLKKAAIRPAVPRIASLSAIMKVAWPAFGEKFLFHFGFLVFAGYVGRLGEEAMTAHQALMAIESLGFIAASAFGIAAGALVAQKLGAKRPEEARMSGYISARLGTSVLCCIGLFFFLFAEPLLGLFTANPAIISVGVECMLIAAVAQPLMALTDVYAGALRGAGDTKTPMLVALVGPLLVRLSACWLFAYQLELGLVGIWLGSTLDWSVRAFSLWLVYRRGKWMYIDV